MMEDKEIEVIEQQISTLMTIVNMTDDFDVIEMLANVIAQLDNLCADGSG